MACRSRQGLPSRLQMDRLLLPLLLLLCIGQLAQALKGDTAVALKLVGGKNDWLSCWGSGDCKFRGCPGKRSNVFEYDKARFKHGYRCKGEIFWIHGKRGKGGEINNCDNVALEYKHGHWLSCPNTSGQCKIRTCPGNTMKGDRWNKCDREVFNIVVEGKKCGAPISNRDKVMLYTDNWTSAMGKRRTCSSSFGCVSVGNDVTTGKVNPSGSTSCIGGNLQWGTCANFVRTHSYKFELYIQ